ncbi:MAG: hypothetical protein J5663_07705 [Bacteroidaceae bacterium]|nr:hypothetical protein [Bacteroidaceae bacterium]
MMYTEVEGRTKWYWRAMFGKVCDTLTMVCCAWVILVFAWVAVPTNEYFDNQK